jgi:hypothetical protein
VSTLRVLKNHSSLLTHTFYVDGDPTDPSPDTATITITRADGTAIVTGAATGNGGVGVFTYALASQTDLDYLTVDWTASFSGQTHVERDYVEIVGGFYVTIAEIQAIKGIGVVSDADAVDARMWFEDRAEAFIGTAFVPRFRRETFDGDGANYLYLSKRPVRRLTAVMIDGTSVPVAEFAARSLGRVVRKEGTITAGHRNMLVSYEYGYDSPPRELSEAALGGIRFKITGDRTGSIDTPEGMTPGLETSYNVNTPGPDRPFGMPDIDQVLGELRDRERVPAVA